jgi:hypothetical protein
MNSPILGELDTAEITNSLNYNTFRRLCAEHPDELFDNLFEHLSRLEMKAGKAAERDEDGDLVDEQREEVAALKERVKEQRNAIAELIQERDEAQQQLYEVEQQGREGSTPAPAPSGKKSSKLPDGKRLSDGKDPKFESWLIDIENKLEANADHYPTALARMQYVKSMCEGEAAEHLLPRFRKDSPQRYRDVNDIIEHLKTIYHDANRVTSAKRTFRRLYMNDTKFQVFLSKFVLNAQESELPATQWKDELYERLSPEMQKQLVKESYDNTLSYQNFVRECHQTANRLEMIAENEKRAPKPRGNKNGSGGGAAKDNKKDATGPEKPKDGQDKLKLSWKERQQLRAEGKCFNCKMLGHMSNECDLNNKTPDLKALEPAKEEAKSSDSENESA